MDNLKIPKGSSTTVTLTGPSTERTDTYQGQSRLYYDFPITGDFPERIWSTGSEAAKITLDQHWYNGVRAVRIELAPIEGGRHQWHFHTSEAPRQESPATGAATGAEIEDKTLSDIKQKAADIVFLCDVLLKQPVENLKQVEEPPPFPEEGLH